MNYKQENKNSTEKLQKVIANTGLGSRREIEKWIAAGRVKVNGIIATLGLRVAPDDLIAVDTKPIKQIQTNQTQKRVLLYYKPEGEICTRSDEKGRTSTVFANLPELKIGRWILIGRLDINSSGLLLLTNDGELANALMHPKTQIEREYTVRVFGNITEEKLANLRHGVLLDGKLANFEKIEKSAGDSMNQWYKVVVTEGRNRLVRRLFDSQNLQVSRLLRIRFHTITLPYTLPRGQFLELTKEKIKELEKLMSNIPSYA